MKVTRKRTLGALALLALGVLGARKRSKIVAAAKQGRVKFRDRRKDDQSPEGAPTEEPDLAEVAGAPADNTTAKDAAAEGDDKQSQGDGDK